MKLKVHMKMSSFSPEFERKVTILSASLHFKEKHWASVQWDKKKTCCAFINQG